MKLAIECRMCYFFRKENCAVFQNVFYGSDFYLIPGIIKI